MANVEGFTVNESLAPSTEPSYTEMQETTWYNTSTTSPVLVEDSVDLDLSAGAILVMCVTIVALFVLVGGNGLVLFSIAKYRFLQNSANMFVAILAAVDLTFSISVALKVAQLVVPTLFVGLAACQFKLILSISNCISSMLALLSIAVTRYLGTFKPFLYESLLTSRRTAYTMVFVVVYPVALVTGLTLRYHRWHPDVPCLYFTIYSPGVVWLINGHVYVTLSAIFIIYLKITHEVVRLKRQIASLLPAPLGQVIPEAGKPVPGQVLLDQRRQRSDFRLLKNFSIIVGMFALSWMPYILLCQVIVYDPLYYLQQPIIINILTGITLVVIMNSMVNPLVYAIRFKLFGIAFRYTFKCITKDEKERRLAEYWWISN